MRFVLLFLVCICGAAEDGSGGGALNLFTPEQERAIGEQLSAELNPQLRLITSAPVSDYLNAVGRRLAPGDRSWRIFVVNTEERSTFALPGGFIYIHRGLIEASETENELAAAIAHEMGHVAGHHAVKHVSKRMLLDSIAVAGAAGPGVPPHLATFTTVAYSLADESESDAAAVARLRAAGFAPRAMLSIVERASRGSAPKSSYSIATHQASPERIERLTAKLAADGREHSPEQGDAEAFAQARAALRELPR